LFKGLLAQYKNAIKNVLQVGFLAVRLFTKTERWLIKGFEDIFSLVKSFSKLKRLGKHYSKFKTHDVITFENISHRSEILQRGSGEDITGEKRSQENIRSREICRSGKGMIASVQLSPKCSLGWFKT
jgi:hypothetical protein